MEAWMLILYLVGTQQPAEVIKDFAAKEDCQRVAAELVKAPPKASLLRGHFCVRQAK